MPTTLRHHVAPSCARLLHLHLTLNADETKNNVFFKTTLSHTKPPGAGSAQDDAGAHDSDDDADSDNDNRHGNNIGNENDDDRGSDESMAGRLDGPAVDRFVIEGRDVPAAEAAAQRNSQGREQEEGGRR